MFLETLQNSQENTCARGEISKNTFSYRTPLVAASAVYNHSQGIVHLVRTEISQLYKQLAIITNAKFSEKSLFLFLWHAYFVCVQSRSFSALMAFKIRISTYSIYMLDQEFSRLTTETDNRNFPKDLILMVETNKHIGLILQMKRFKELYSHNFEWALKSMTCVQIESIHIDRFKHVKKIQNGALLPW